MKKGDVLFEIDPRPFKALVDFSKAQVAVNEALDKKAKLDNARNKLVAKTPGAVSQQDLDLSQAAEDQAVAQVENSKASLETNQLNLGFTKVLSPIDGRISRYNLTEGNLVVQDQTLLTTIVSVNPMYVYFDVDEHTVLEVRKMIRAGKANISDAFARIENGEAFLYNADIQPYERASHEIPTAKRVRKLLLHREEIDRLYGESQVKGRALVVLKLYWKNGKVKAEVGVGMGKLAHDKRADLKKRVVDRETAREVARFNRKHA